MEYYGTLGPACGSVQTLKEMRAAGMTGVRLNLSHGDLEENGHWIRMVQEAGRELHSQVQILMDLRGPELRLGRFREEIQAEEGSWLVLGDGGLPVPEEALAYVCPGDRILIDDGLIELHVREVQGPRIVCLVVNGGELGEKKGVNVPGVRVKLPALTDKDKEDIRFGVDAGFDFVAASFVRNADAIREIREILDEKGSAMQIIAKIENEEGIENIDSIIEASDGIMVARGDMGVEIPAEKVPHIQKMIIRKCNLACKVVITATQMLDSMIRNPRPTRAEVSDVANAVYEGTDAVMLSGETAMGSYPIEAVRMMSQIAEESEKYLDYMFYQRRKVSAENLRNISNTVCYSSVATASDLEAPVIVAPSVSGFTTRMLSKWRPKALIAGLSPSMTAVRQMQLYWGVKPFHAKRAESTDALLFASVELLKEKGIVKEGEIVVATAGVVTRANRHEPVADTNIMRVIVVE